MCDHTVTCEWMILTQLFIFPQLGRAMTGWVQGAFQTYSSSAAAAQPQRALEENAVTEPELQECPVCAYNEWDPLEEVIVGRAENARVPPFTVEVKVRSSSQNSQLCRANLHYVQTEMYAS